MLLLNYFQIKNYLQIIDDKKLKPIAMEMKDMECTRVTGAMKNPLASLCIALLINAVPLSTKAQTTLTYDGKNPLQCGVSVNCVNQFDVVTKMKTRWIVYSSKTNYGNICFDAIKRVQGINARVWDAGMAQQQMEVCNMQ